MKLTIITKGAYAELQPREIVVALNHVAEAILKNEYNDAQVGFGGTVETLGAGVAEYHVDQTTESKRQIPTLISMMQEFSTLEELTKQYECLRGTPVVDDDFPEIRQTYERAAEAFVFKFNENRNR